MGRRIGSGGEDADRPGGDGAWRGEVSDLRRQEGLNPTMYYTWKRIHLGAADRVSEKKASKVSARVERLSKELTRAKDVIAEITAENLDLKKTFSP